MGVVARREVARGEKTVVDQGVPWMNTKVFDGVVGWEEVAVGEERRVYLISQLS